MKPTAPDLLAIDPGTYTMGLALFTGDTLDSAWDVHAGGDIGPRLQQMLEYIARVFDAWPDVRTVACEKTAAIEGVAPAPELQTLIRAIRGATRRSKREWAQYHPSTVVAAVRPRGLRGAPSKEVIRLGVRLLYPDSWVAAEYATQDAYDAVAVGHCHLSRQLSKAKEGTP